MTFNKTLKLQLMNTVVLVIADLTIQIYNDVQENP